MQVPGGCQTLPEGRPNGAKFAVLDGHSELALWDAVSSGKPRAQAISAILNTAFDFDQAETDTADMCTADREYLLSRLAIHAGMETLWVSGTCGACEKPFDVPISMTDLPLKPAGESYPFASVEHENQTYRVRVPTGRDLAAMASLPDEEALIALARRCIMEDIENVEALIPLIDAALEEIAPEIPDRVSTTCPSCDHEADLKFDIAKAVCRTFNNPLSDVHDIASVYHWSEAQILDLPKSRREAYLSLIDQENSGVR